VANRHGDDDNNASWLPPRQGNTARHVFPMPPAFPFIELEDIVVSFRTINVTGVLVANRQPFSILKEKQGASTDVSTSAQLIQGRHKTICACRAVCSAGSDVSNRPASLGTGIYYLPSVP